MVKRKLPWFPFYAGDWLADAKVRLLSVEAKGAYLTLIATQWVSGPLPSDPDQIAILIEDREVAKRVWPQISQFFAETDDGRLVNPRLEEVRLEQEKAWRSQVRGGRLGAQSRWGAHRSPNGIQNQNQNQNHLGGGGDHASRLSPEGSGANPVPASRDLGPEQGPEFEHKVIKGKLLRRRERETLAEFDARRRRVDE